MACYFPRDAYLGALQPNGKRRVVFDRVEGIQPVRIPCGGCMGCRLERAREWAVRLMHEAELHEQHCFITLTYSDEHLPVGGSLTKSDFQKFMKRLRRAFSSRKILFFHCGEYGEGLRRPHYHAILFGIDFHEDRVPFKKTETGDQLFRSRRLEKLWKFGYSTIGQVTFESARYVASYVTKKITGDPAKAHYTVVDAEGEMHELLPEYATMSLKPAIGKRWVQRFHGDVYPSGFVVVGGNRQKPPKAYDRFHEEVEPQAVADVQALRRAFAVEPRARRDRTPRRLAVRHEVKKAVLSLYNKRSFSK